MEQTPGIDERIAQIDVARDSLESALSAIGELKAAAERNKEELRTALGRIEEARAAEAAAEKELENVKQIAQADVEVFKKLAGVPSRAQIARERFIGFVIGVVASLAAWGILRILERFWGHLKP
jgi:chromosome segregation ATPase